MFDLTETIRDIETQMEENYRAEANPSTKIFYDLHEWDGWRFYRKALLNGDFQSLIGHIKSNYFPHK